MSYPLCKVTTHSGLEPLLRPVAAKTVDRVLRMQPVFHAIAFVSDAVLLLDPPLMQNQT
jgi:hypothetical protein